MDMKNIVGQYVFLSYNNFSEQFLFHTYDSKTHIGGLISQNRDPVAFYSLKLTHAQINYTPMEQEIFGIVETLKELCTSILGHHITVYKEQDNITYVNFITERVLR